MFDFQNLSVTKSNNNLIKDIRNKINLIYIISRFNLK